VPVTVSIATVTVVCSSRASAPARERRFTPCASRARTSVSLAEKHELAFDVLSDLGCDTAKQYGLAFDLPDDLAAVYAGFGIDLDRSQAGHARTLPIPATYVIDRAGTIRWAFADADYTSRAEPDDILAALDALA
jgi:peroxiredoxin